MIADLHAHSNRSDGTLSPAAVVARARERGVTMLALTDHDSTDGLAEAAQAARGQGIELVNGVELSCRWQGTDVHVVGLAIDPVRLAGGLAAQQAARAARAQRIAERLQRAGAGEHLAAACALAGSDHPGRPHFARALVAAGVVRDEEHAFNRYLRQGQAAYVPTDWVGVSGAVAWIRAAGGVAVIAHPARYRLTRTRLRRLVAEFAAAGGQALEVKLPGQQPSQVEAMVRLADEFGLAGSVASDFHGPGSPWADLGAAGSLPPGARPVWELWCC